MKTRSSSNNRRNNKSKNCIETTKHDKNISAKKSKKIKELIEEDEIDEEDNTGQLIIGDKNGINGNDLVLSSLYTSMMSSFGKVAGISNTLNQLNDEIFEDTEDTEDTENVEIEQVKKTKKSKIIKRLDVLPCPNKLCNHKKNKKFTPSLPKFSLTLNYLIELGNMYHCKNFKNHNHLNLHDLCNMVPYMHELNEMIGMKQLKLSIVEQLFYFLKGNYKINNDCNECYSCKSNEKYREEHSKNEGSIFYKRDDKIFTPLLCEKKPKNPLHFMLLGPPGTGKTQTAKIIGKIYSTLGLLSKGTFKMINATDCHTGHIGETSKVLNEYIQESLGGCLFIDEIYGIGNGGSSSNSITVREFVNTLTPALTNYSDFAVGIAGYKQAVKDNIFAFNEGLRGRFMFTYELDPYTSRELFLIFEKMIKMRNIYILFTKDKEGDEYKKNAGDCILLFEQNKIHITDNGRDIESIIHHTVTNNSICENTVFDEEEQKYYITFANIETGVEKLASIKSLNTDHPPLHMYM